MKNLQQIYFRFWRPAVLVLSLGLVAYFLFFHNLSHLLPGYSNREVYLYNTSSNWHTILKNPIDAPYKLVVLSGIILGHHSWLLTRIAAAGFGVLGSLVFFTLVRSWYGYSIGFLATILFATSSGFLHVARLGSGLILQLSVLLLIGAVFGYRQSRHRTLAAYALAALFAVLLYVPGMVWFELLALTLFRTNILRLVRQADWKHLVGWVVLPFVVAAPLIHVCINTPSIVRTIAGLPSHFISASHMLSNLGTALLSIAMHSNGTPELWLGHAPLLNIIEAMLLLLGAYMLSQKIHSVRSLGLLGATLISLILISLGGPVGFTSLVPLLYLYIAGGLHALLQRWLNVFPRNPIARTSGIGLVCVLVFFSVLYQWRSYYVAWPHNTATKQVFNKHQP